MFDFAIDCVRLQVISRSKPLGAAEPLTFGLPFPRGWLTRPETLRLITADGQLVPHQQRILESWCDGSVRWGLFDFIATGPSRQHYELRRGSDRTPSPRVSLQVRREPDGVQVETGVAGFRVSDAGDLLVKLSNSASAECRVRILGDDGASLSVVARRELIVEEAGPIRASVVAEAIVNPIGLHLQCRYEFFDQLPGVRVSLRLRNPTAAVHDGGFWDLGDPHSRFIREWAFVVSPTSSLGAVTCSTEPGAPSSSLDLPFELHQESSGGEQWASSTHFNRHGVVPMMFRGYRMRSSTQETHGGRANPLIEALDTAGEPIVAIGMPGFWERFPKAVAVDTNTVTVGLLPGQFPDVHELQPGEQLTERFVMAFGPGARLEWARDPAVVRAEPDWYCAAEAAPHLVPVAVDSDPRYESFVKGALDDSQGFVAKREWIDEYGWRNFGDLYADHETVFHQGSAPLVSHYNNQYDAVAGFAVQFFRTADERWLSLMESLARHVVDIDVYHTFDDKPGYSGGMFWHTNHHIDAGTATHRTYPRTAGRGGGPSAEHNYNTGLMLYHFVTGDPGARTAAIDLADWVIAMDDGQRTPLRWLSQAPTGLASATGSMNYHGPGRGPGNSIVVLINAWRLTKDRRYLMKAEELIHRCVHPQQDLDALDLLDAERRWYYTVFLQALSRYLECKEELGESDNSYKYARAVLLHYGRWMERNERPYLAHPERLEFPNETWVAQDMRKCEVLDLAAKHTDDLAERARFRQKAQYFFDYVVDTLPTMSRTRFTRPMVLLLTNGYSHSFFQAAAASSSEPTIEPQFGPPVRFRTQREIALQRAAVLGALVAGVVTVLVFLAALVW